MNRQKIKGQLDATDWFLLKIYCSLNMFRVPLCPSSGAQELYRWLLPVVLGALVYRSLVWCGAVGCVPGLRDAARAVLDSYYNKTRKNSSYRYI